VPKAVAIEAKEWLPLNGPHLPSVGTSRYDQSGNQNMLELTELQHLELQRSDESPPGILDPVTNTRYVLVRSDEFDRVRSIVESGGLDMRQVGQLVNAAMRRCAKMMRAIRPLNFIRKSTVDSDDQPRRRRHC